MGYRGVAGMEGAARRAFLKEWHDYYSAKRLGHHSVQLDLIGRHHRGGKILEIGPGFGLLTAALANAGYDVTVLDVVDRRFDSPAVPALMRELTTLRAGELDPYDMVVCCETLEHLYWDQVNGVLAALNRAGRTLIVSVPYEAFQVQFSLYFNLHAARRHFALKKFRAFKTFKPREGYEHHKWEVGYRGHSLKAWEAKIERAGWTIDYRTFSSPARSVFHVLRSGSATGVAPLNPR